MKRISLRTPDDKQVFSVAIRSFKQDRRYILGLFCIHPEVSHLVCMGRRYNAADIYSQF